MSATYVLYRGDEIVDIGTAYQIARRQNISASTVAHYATESYKRRMEKTDRGNRLVAVRVDG